MSEKKYDLDPNFLELEITESVFIENFHDVTEKLRLLREYGIKVSLDDFWNRDIRPFLI